MTRISTRELVSHIDETLDRVVSGERIVLERENKPSVVLVPLDELNRMEEELPPPVPTSEMCTIGIWIGSASL